MLLIDGYNLLYKNHQIKDDKSLIFAIADRCKISNKRAILVFDGEWDYEGEYDTDLLQVEYVQDADSRIRDLILSNQKSTVVSSDNEIRHFAKNHGSKCIKSEDFIIDFDTKENNKDPGNSPNIHVSDEDINEYIELLKSKKNIF